METLQNLAFGFEHALTLHNLMYCAIGCSVGTLVGLLPGLGPLATISLLLPLTYSISTTGALIMLAGKTAAARDDSQSQTHPRDAAHTRLAGSSSARASRTAR